MTLKHPPVPAVPTLCFGTIPNNMTLKPHSKAEFLTKRFGTIPNNMTLKPITILL
ncbi:conserved hypothetical protein [Enterococcus faecalis ARO1/DG]|nr:conserved hypothetical protein [Enterococcus faecalis ARO1/DG]